MQEAVLVEADVDERRLEPGQDVVDLALVDVADDGAVAAALEVELGDAPVLLGGAAPAASPAWRGVPVASSSATRVSPRSTLTSTCFFTVCLLSVGEHAALECRGGPALHIDRLQEAEGQQSGDDGLPP